jgi:BASS family bile acid:Na+ symporter
MLRIDWPSLRLTLGRPLVSALAVGWVLLALPALVWAATAPLGLPEELRRSLALVAAMPPILSAPALSLLLGLDAATALVAVVAATLLVPLTLPPVAALTAGAAIAEPLALFARLAAVVGGALLASLALRALAGPARLARRAAEIDGVGVILLLLFAVALMDGVPAHVASRPQDVALYAAAAFAANLGMQVLGTAAFRPAGMRVATTVGFVGGNRNAALLLAVLPGADPALLLFVAVAQFPIYLLPSLLLPIYRRLGRAA